MVTTQRFKVKALIDIDVEFEAPLDSKSRNEAIKTQLLEHLRPNEHLVEFSIVDQNGTAVDKTCTEFFGLSREFFEIDRRTMNGILTSDLQLKNAVLAARNSVRPAEEKPGGFFRLTVRDNRASTTQPGALLQLTDGKETEASIPESSKRVSRRHPVRLARINRTPLTSSDIEALDKAKEQLVATQEKWANRRQWMKNSPEEFQLLQRERSRLQSLISNIQDYGMEIAQSRLSKNLSKTADVIQKLQEERDARAVDSILREMDDLTVNASPTSRPIADSLKSHQQTDRELDFIPFESEKMSRRRNSSPARKHEYFKLSTKLDKIHAELRRQRDRSRSPGKQMARDHNRGDIGTFRQRSVSPGEWKWKYR